MENKYNKLKGVFTVDNQIQTATLKNMIHHLLGLSLFITEIVETYSYISEKMMRVLIE